MQRIRNLSAAHSGKINLRRGTATVEVAVFLPVLMMISLGSIEAAQAIHMKHVATVAAYEAAQVVTATTGTISAATTKANSLLAARNAATGTVSISPASANNAARGTPITVTVQIPLTQSLIGVAYMFEGTTVRAQVVMQKL